VERVIHYKFHVCEVLGVSCDECQVVRDGYYSDKRVGKIDRIFRFLVHKLTVYTQADSIIR